MKDGFELRKSSGKGEGIFATKVFKVGDIVMVGVIEEALNGNHSHFYCFLTNSRAGL